MPDSALSPQLEIELESMFLEAIRKHGLPGLAVGITRDFEPVYVGVFGVLDQSTRGPVTQDTLFHMASVSKSLVSTAVMQLAERGRIRLDDLIVKYLRYFRFQDERSDDITIRQVLSHVSGIPHVRDTQSYNWHKPEYDDGALERYVRGLKTTQLACSPSEKFSYSDIGYDILGDLIAKVSGIPFEGYVREHLLSPLGMKASNLCAPREANPTLVAKPHVLNADGESIVSSVYPYNRVHAPSSTFCSNIIEMNTWAMVHLRRGELDGHRILSQSSYEVMWAPVVTVSPKVSMGLGWFIRNSDAGTEVYLTGTDHGFTTQFSLYLDWQLSVTVICNAEWGKPWKIAADAAQVIMKDSQN